MKPTNRLPGFSMILLLICQINFGQDFEELITESIQTVLESTTNTYYGIDFSFLTLVNAEKIYHGEKIWKTYCPAWLEMYDDTYTTKKVQKSLVIDTIIDHRYPFQKDQYLKNSAEMIVVLAPVEMTTEYLKTIVQAYQLDEGSGIGLSLIVTEFNKPLETVTAFVTFFDIKTRKLLFMVEVYGWAIKAGMTRHWYYGIHDAWSDYFGQEFRYEKRKALRNKKKANS